MPKINPIAVWVSGKGQNHFSHSYETHVLADGTFQTLIPPDQVAWIERHDLSGVLITKNKADKPILKAKNLADISRVVHAYGRSTLEVETTTERLIFYRVRLDVAYCTNPHLPGEVFANGYTAKRATGGENDYRWRGASKNGGGLVKSEGHAVGVAAAVVDKHINRMSDGRFHIEHSMAKFPYGDTSSGAALNEFNAGVFPSNEFWSPTDPDSRRHPLGADLYGDRMFSDALHYLPYTEEAAAFFHGMMMNIATLAERLRLFFGDGGDTFLENLNNGNAQLLLGQHKRTEK